MQGLLQRTETAPVIEDAERIASEKRRRLNRITGAIDSEAKNDQKRRVMSADVDHVRVASDVKRAAVITPQPDAVGAGDEELDALDDGSFVDRVLKKKERRTAKRNAPAGPHHYSFKDSVDPGARRRASTQVVLNRGLARYRPKEKRPRAQRISWRTRTLLSEGRVWSVTLWPSSLGFPTVERLPVLTLTPGEALDCPMCKPVEKEKRARKGL